MERPSPIRLNHSLGTRLLRLCALVLVFMGCAKGAPPPPLQEEKLVVFAASSLRGAFTGMGKEFERAHPKVKLEFNFAGTQELRAQIEQGAEADVFASADQRHMGALVEKGKVAAPLVFAKNEPVLVVFEDAAKKVASFADLPLAERIVIGVPEVPIGRYTLQILDRAANNLGGDFRAKVEARVVSKELNVRQIYSKIRLGEADAGIVYRTDLQAGDPKVVLVSIPIAINVIAEYPIAVLTSAKSPNLAKAWVTLVTSPTGRDLLKKAAFVTP